MHSGLRISMIAACLFLAPLASSQADDLVERKAREIERLVHVLINRERAREGIRPLAVDRRLADLARSHSKRMAERGFFSHEDPDRGGLRARLDRARIGWTMIAENISYARTPRATAAQFAHDAVKRWLNSPGHRENLKNPRLTHTGIGAAFSRNGALYLTQSFLRQ